MKENASLEDKTALQGQLMELVGDYLTQKQAVLMQVKKGIMSREEFLGEVRRHVDHYYPAPPKATQRLLESFEQ